VVVEHRRQVRAFVLVLCHLAYGRYLLLAEPGALRNRARSRLTCQRAV